MFAFKDRRGATACLGPTHEEVITDILRREIKSYKDLPKCAFQIQTKFRDEIRPRFGLMRAREFIMKDAYSFDADEAGLEVSYEAMRQAYHRICQRIGFQYRAVEADPGAIGGSGSQEFMVLADTGEDTILFCDQCDYAANQERAQSRLAGIPAGHRAEADGSRVRRGPDRGRAAGEVPQHPGLEDHQDPDLPGGRQGRGRHGPRRLRRQRGQGREFPGLQGTAAGLGRNDQGN